MNMSQQALVRTVLVGVLAVLCGTVVPAQEAPKTAPPSIAGKWTLTLITENFTSTPALDLKLAGEKVTGTYTSRYGEFPLEGTLKGRAIQFGLSLTAEGTTVKMSFEGEVAADGQTMKGKATIAELGEATWTAARPK
jgi:hypothetical protein